MLISDTFAVVLRALEIRGVVIDWNKVGVKFKHMTDTNGVFIKNLAMRGCTHSDVLITFSGITDSWRAMSFALYLCYQFEENIIDGAGLERGACRLASTMVSAGMSFSGY